jgi:quercetin dioxygenase-like cupin family protein
MDTKKLLEKSKIIFIVKIIKYVSNAIVSKTILKKTTGSITATSIAIGEELAEKTSSFDTYIQIIDGAAELKINGKSMSLKHGDCIIIPAYAKQSFTAKESFKMLTTIIKS